MEYTENTAKNADNTEDTKEIIENREAPENFFILIEA